MRCRPSTEAQIPALEAQARTMEHAIAVLLAVEPNALAAELDADRAVAGHSRQPAGGPAVRSACAAAPMCAKPNASWPQATAEEGVAIAALYPKFNLIGAINLASNSLGSLFNSTSLNEVGRRA